MITAIDASTALVLIDLQRGIASRKLAHSSEDVILNAVKLMEAFHHQELPVVIVHVNPVGAPASRVRAEQSLIPRDEAGQQKALEDMLAHHFFDIVPPVSAASREGDIRVTKSTWNAFRDTDLHQELQARGVTGIVLAGISTSIGVESTARTANELGYNLSFATDAMTDSSEAAHENSRQRIFPRIGETGTTAEIVSSLNSRPR